MAYNASHRFARIAPRKARLVSDMVRGLPVDEALTALDFSKRRGAWYLKSVLKVCCACLQAYSVMLFHCAFPPTSIPPTPPLCSQ